MQQDATCILQIRCFFPLAQAYLDNFYPSVNKEVKTLEERIKEMQAFFQLTVTGRIDEETLKIMHQPRCGVPDTKYKPFPGMPTWKKKSLTYRLVVFQSFIKCQKNYLNNKNK